MVSTLLFLKFSLYLQVRSFACRIICKGHRPEAAPRTGDFRSRRAIWSLEERNRESDFRRIARASGDWEVSRGPDLIEEGSSSAQKKKVRAPLGIPSLNTCLPLLMIILLGIQVLK